MGKAVLLSLFIFTSSLYGQEFVKMDTIVAPENIALLVPEQIKRTFLVDFDGNGTKDYICQLSYQDTISPTFFKEIWISSEGNIIKSINKPFQDYDFFWFVNLDDDPEPEIFSASGWCEGIDYCFIDQDLQKGSDQVMFYFNPVIIENKKIFWGYPWDINGIITSLENKKMKLRCSLDHKVTRDREITRPDWQKVFPVICFTGHSTQPNITVGKIKRFEWLNTHEILDKIKK
jgi:hypothetical protein